MLILSFLFYLFLVRYSLFLLVLALLDSFSSCFQSLTLCNRLAINILAGSLLGSLLGVALKHFTYFIVFTLIINRSDIIMLFVGIVAIVI